MASMGIDFGTCFSSAGFINGNKMMALKPQTEKRPGRIPSVFYHDKKITCYGTEALKKGKNRPKFMVEYIKKKLDEPFFVLDEQQYTPFEIVRELMEYVIKGAEQSAREEFQLGDQEKWNAVITVPVTFSESRKRMLRQAAENVELSNNRHVNIIEMIPEPVAAAISYLGMNQMAGRSILVYDLGGGTFDTAVVQSTGNPETPYKVIGQDGRGIGGNDWDESLLEIIMRKIFDKMEDIPEERRYNLLGKERARLLQLARQIKEDLSEAVQVEEEILIRDADYVVEISRQEFEDATRHLLNETIRPVVRLFKKFSDYNISEIILVGGSSYMPQVFNTLVQSFPEVAVHRVNPELAISFGAAYYAALKEKMKKPVQLKATHTYGMVYTDENGSTRIHNMIFKGTDLPAEAVRNAMMSDPDKYYYISVYESDCESDEPVIERSRADQVMNVTVPGPKKGGSNMITKQRLMLTQDNLLQVEVIDETRGFFAVRKLDIKSEIH